MQLTTPVTPAKSDIKISHKSNILFLGSCFAQNIGNILLEHKFNACINPFGIIYNPLSIATALARIANKEFYTMQSPEVVKHGELWHSMMHHSDFSRNDKEQLLTAVNTALEQACTLMHKADIVIITFGTAYTYLLKSNGQVVSNCHKMPANLFERKLLSIEEITANMERSMRIIMEERPCIKFLFTVSPIRHLRDGAHDNQVSKSTLLLAVEELRKRFPSNTAYFPAYEIMLDELRDYRFYAEDMTHPSKQAVEYIHERFSECYFEQPTISLNNTIEEINRCMAHRPFNPESNAYKEFINNLLQKIEAVKEKNPFLDLENEKKRCLTLLNK